jgi:hypothetical protein
MAINTHGSGIRVETNVGGELLDNDAFVIAKANYEHNLEAMPQDTNPWATNYRPREVVFEDTVPAIQPDPELEEANARDLKNRLHIYPN